MDDEYDGYRVYEVALPGDIYGAIRMDEDGFASIYINNLLAPEQKKKTLDHEVRHLKRNDFCNDLSIYDCEKDD